MALESVNHQCPACGGPLHFASAEQKLVCDYCDSRFEVEEVEALYRERQGKADAKADAAGAAPKPAADDAVQELAQNAGYICSSCGAELVSDGTVAVTTCPYCGNSAVAPGQLSGDFSPDLVIPFNSGAKTPWLRSRNTTRARSCCPRALSPATTSTRSKVSTCHFGSTAPTWTARSTSTPPMRP